MRWKTQDQYLETRAVYDFDIGDQRNTRSMDMRPESPAEYSQLDELQDGKAMTLLPVFSGEAFQKAVVFPVIVEAWDKKSAGKHKRRWEATFTPAERKKIAIYYGRFYKWYLVSGVPRKVSVRLNTLTLLQKAVNFFAEC